VEEHSENAQVGAALHAIQDALRPTRIVGAYLYGSAVAGGFRPDSDVDLFVVTDQPLEAGEKSRIVAGMMPLSGRETRPSGWRPIELTVVVQSDVRPWRYPPRMDFLYGEWLRSDFAAGKIAPARENPDLAVLVTMVRERSRRLMGPPATDVLDSVPSNDLRRAMVDTIPFLFDDLGDDTRNVLLTLARAWSTAATGDIRSKDEAADWALARLPEVQRPMLARARDLYRDGGYGDWPDPVAVRHLADLLAREIRGA
jgi:predicted nucleotidyltransferase